MIVYKKLKMMNEIKIKSQILLSTNTKVSSAFK